MIYKVVDIYNYSETTIENLSYTSSITEKFKNFDLCITSFML